MAAPQKTGQQPQPDQGLKHPVLDGAVAAALAAGGATIAGLAPAAAGAAAPAGVALTDVAVAKLTQEMIEAVLQHQRGRVRTRAKELKEFLAETYPERPPSAIDQAVSGEVAKEREFTKKMQARLERDLAEALKIVDPDERRAKVRKILEREQHYLELRELAMNDRSIAFLERMSVKEQSPQGAFWKLSPYVKEHTPDCIAMGEKFWPWSVLNEINPPTHHGCRCSLLTLDEAVERDYMDPEHANVVDWAALQKAKELLKEARVIAEACTLEEFRAHLLELSEEAQMSGAMVALYPPKHVAKKLALKDGDPPAQLHVTMKYLTEDHTDLSDKEKGDIVERVARWAEREQPFEARIREVGEFPAQENGDVPQVAHLEHPEFQAMRRRLVDSLPEFVMPDTHPKFKPHMTLRYVPEGKSTAKPKPALKKIPLGEVHVVFGGKRTRFVLGEPRDRRGRWMRESADLEELYVEALHPRDRLGKYAHKIKAARDFAKAEGVDVKLAFHPGDASPLHPLRGEYRMRAAAAILENHAEIPNAVLLLPEEHERRAEVLKKVVQGDVARAVKEYALTPVGDLEILAGVQVETHPVHGQANANLVTRKLQMGSTSNIGDFRHELGHALRAAWGGRGGPTGHTPLTNYVSERHKEALARVQHSIETHQPKPKTEPEWEEKVGVADPRALDNWEEDFAEQYRIYHRSLYQSTHKDAPPPYTFDPEALNRYRKLHPEWARLWDAWYTAQLVGRIDDKDLAEAIQNKSLNGDGLEEAYVPLRYKRGTHEGGQFMPRHGAHPHPLSKLKRALLRDLVPELPRTPKQRRHVHREYTIDGRRVRVPESRPFARTFGDNTYESPAGTTELLRDGKPYVPQPGVSGQKLSLRLPQLSKSDAARQVEERGIADAADLARAAMVAGSSSQLPARVGADGWTTDNGLRDAGFLETAITQVSDGLRVSFVAPDGVSKLNVIYSKDAAKVMDVDWTPRPAPVVGPRLNRPPHTWSEFTADVESFARTIAAEHGRGATLSRFVVDQEIVDHGGEHMWDGTIRLGADVMPDVTAMAIATAQGHKLTEAQKARTWASYEAAVHEALHAAAPIGVDEFDRVGMALEESLTEELAHRETVKMLRRQGLDDVVQWVADHPDHPAVLGSYPSYRSALDKLMSQAKVAPELREEMVERLKWARPADRVTMLARAIAQADPTKSPMDAEHRVRGVIENVGRPDWEEPPVDWDVVPLVIPNVDPRPPTGHEVAGAELEPGDQVYVNRRVRDKQNPDSWSTVRTEGVVLSIRDAEGGWVFDVDYGHGQLVGYAVLPQQVITVEKQGQTAGRVSFGAQTRALDLGNGDTITRGDVVRYDGRLDGKFSEARVVRVVRAENPLGGYKPSWIVEAVTTGDSLRPGQRVWLTSERVGGQIEVVTPAEILQTKGVTGAKLVRPLTLERKAQLDKRFVTPHGAAVVPLRYVTTRKHPRPSQLRERLRRLTDPSSPLQPPAGKVRGDGRVEVDDAAVVQAATQLGMTHMPVRLQGPTPYGRRFVTIDSSVAPLLYDELKDTPLRDRLRNLVIDTEAMGGAQGRPAGPAQMYLDSPEDDRLIHDALKKLASDASGYPDLTRWPLERLQKKLGGEYVGTPVTGQRQNPWQKSWWWDKADGLESQVEKWMGSEPQEITVDPKRLRGYEIVKDADGKTWRTSLTGTNKKPTVTLISLEGETVVYPEKDLPPLTLVQGSNAKPYVPPPPPEPVWDDSKLVEVKGWAGGSNGARIAETADGQRWLVKAYRGDQDRVATELLANAVYRKLGVAVPEAGTLTFGGKPALAYPMLDGELRRWKEPNADLAAGFMADALLANWDVIGLDQDNILWQGDKPVRLDQGGTLQFRAQGEKKTFGPVPSEVWTMASAKGGQAFSTMALTDEVKLRGARKIARTLSGPVVDELVDAAPFQSSKMRDEVRTALKARVGWMRAYAQGKVDEPRPLTGTDALEELRQVQQKMELRPEQDVAVRAFGQGWDATVNDHLRTGAPKAAAAKEVQFIVAELDAVMRKARTNRDIVGYAAVASPPDDKELQGRNLRDRGFLGLSLEMGPAAATAEKTGGSVARVVIPAGSSAVYLPGLADDMPGQPEILLERDSRLRILTSSDDRKMLETVLTDKPPRYVPQGQLQIREAQQDTSATAMQQPTAKTGTGAAWNTQLHPRAGKGNPAGGQFTRKPSQQQQAVQRRLQAVGPTPHLLKAGFTWPGPATELPQLEGKLPLPNVKVYETENTTVSLSVQENRSIYLAKPVAEMLLHGSQNSDLHSEAPWAFAIYTLYHEMWHMAFDTDDEKNCDLGALAIMREMMRKHWGLSEKDAQKNYEIVAGKPGVAGKAGTAYHPDYTPTARDPLLGDAPAVEKIKPGADLAWSDVRGKARK